MGFHDSRMAWPEGRFAALTTSWDDGVVDDERLVEIFNRYGVKGTFNLNAGALLPARVPDGRRVVESELATLYRGHEVAVHTEHHPWLEMLPDEGVVAEVMRDRARLEAAVGYPVKGMALPFGTYRPRTLAVLSACGILHCRTTVATKNFNLPENFLEWHPTCHQADAELFSMLERVAASDRRAQLYYVWGHSYEFPRDESWERFDDFAAQAGADARIWHATNMEVVDYVTAWRALRWTADGTTVYNPSALTLWAVTSEGPRSVAPGACVRW